MINTIKKMFGIRKERKPKTKEEWREISKAQCKKIHATDKEIKWALSVTRPGPHSGCCNWACPICGWQSDEKTVCAVHSKPWYDRNTFTRYTPIYKKILLKRKGKLY